MIKLFNTAFLFYFILGWCILEGGRSFFLFLYLRSLALFFSLRDPFEKLDSKLQLSCWLKRKIANLINLKLLEVKSSLFNFNLIINFLFFLILRSNYLGLLVIIPQNFLGKISVRLLIMALRIWAFTYYPIITVQKEKISLFVIGEIKFPSLSLLLSNIEILTHLFRPITLTARLWVNIWVGHLILSGGSFIVGRITKGRTLLGFLKSETGVIRFFIFECLIIFLQTFVFTYLIKVYFEENQHHADIVI